MITWKQGFYVARCPNNECAWYQAQEFKELKKATFRCRRCKKNKKIKQKNKYALTIELQGPLTAKQASKLVQELNAQKRKT